MAQITLKGTPFHTSGDLPVEGSQAPDFRLTRGDLSEITLSELSGKTLVLNIFPSVDTPVCANSVRKFNEALSAREGVDVLCVSADLPFAQGRFCGAEGLERVTPVSTFRNPEFGQDYGVTISDGPFAGLLARAVVVVRDGQVVYRQLVEEIADEPDYESALAALN